MAFEFDYEYEELLQSLFEEFCEQLGVSDQPREPLIETDAAAEPESAPDPDRVDTT